MSKLNAPLANDRFARHRLIEGFDQTLICSLRVALIGAGAIGNEVLKNFLLMGIGAVDVYDFDTVEESNLTRSVFLRSSDIGQNKAVAVVQRAQELHPDTRLRAIAGDIYQTLSLTATKQYDFVFCAVDNFEARLRINEMTRITSTDWINCAIDSRNVVVELYPANTQPSACYACGLPDSSYERIARRYSCGGLQRAAYLEKTVPTTAITASIGAALGVAQAFTLARHRHQSTQTPLPVSRIFMDTDLPNAQRVQLSINPQCPVCSELGSVPAAATSITANGKLFDWLATLAEQEPIIFSDAIITKAQCKRCEPSPRLRALIGQRAKSITDTVATCEQCQREAVELEFLEMCPISDLLDKKIALDPGQPAWLQHGQHYYDRVFTPSKSKEPQ